MNGKKTQKKISKVLTKVLLECGININEAGRHGFVITVVSEDADGSGLSCASLLVDPECEHEEGMVEAVKSGGHVGFITHTAHEVFAESLEEIVKRSQPMVEISDIMNTLFENMRKVKS
jgi:hypothetical protein